MSEKLPGAEYAPIIAIDLLRNEQRLADADEVAKLGGDAILLIGGLNQRVIRRLSCTDPDDQRAIWRRAAIHLGYDEETASTAVLSLRQMPEYEEVVDWMLVVHAGLCDEEYLWSPHGDLDPPESREEATAALCASVWGPK